MPIVPRLRNSALEEMTEELALVTQSREPASKLPFMAAFSSFPLTSLLPARVCLPFSGKQLTLQSLIQDVFLREPKPR